MICSAFSFMFKRVWAEPEEPDSSDNDSESDGDFVSRAARGSRLGPKKLRDDAETAANPRHGVKSYKNAARLEAKKAELEKPPKILDVHACTLCGVDLISTGDVTNHLKSKKHLKRQAAWLAAQEPKAETKTPGKKKKSSLKKAKA